MNKSEINLFNLFIDELQSVTHQYNTVLNAKKILMDKTNYKEMLELKHKFEGAQEIFDDISASMHKIKAKIEKNEN